MNQSSPKFATAVKWSRDSLQQVWSDSLPYESVFEILQEEDSIVIERHYCFKKTKWSM